MRADHLGCYGDPKKFTPNLDAFAAESMVFKNAFSVAPWTYPANAAIFTGLYPHQVCDGDAALLTEQATTLAEYFKQAGYKTAAFSAHPIISRRWKFDQGFETFWNIDGTWNRDADEQVLARSLSWLKDNRKKNYFLLIYFFSPHEPYRCSVMPEEIKDTWLDLRPVIRAGSIPFSAQGRKPVFVDEITDEQRAFKLRHTTSAEIEALHALYYGAIKDDDRRIHNILETINDDPETVIAIVSDHGEEWLDHGGLRHREMLYKELLHVPLILHIPESDGKSISTPVSTLDLSATLLELAEIKSPLSLPGRNLSKITNQEANQPLFSDTYHSRGFDRIKVKGMEPIWVERYAVRTHNRTLIHSLAGWSDEAPIPDGGRWEYFDLSSDQTEQTSLPLDENGEALKLQLLGFEKSAKQKIIRKTGADQELQKKLEDMKNLGYIGN